MARKKIQVCVKGYTREDGTRVRRHCYMKKDVGAAGKGPKVVQKSMGRQIKSGKLGKYGYSTSAGAETRHRALDKAVTAYGYASVRGMVGVQAHVFRKRQKDHAKNVFMDDFEWLVKEYGEGK